MSDDGVRVLSKRASLTELTLRGCVLTSEGASRLGAMHSLTRLEISGTAVSADVVTSLRQSLPTACALAHHAA